MSEIPKGTPHLSRIENSPDYKLVVTAKGQGRHVSRLTEEGLMQLRDLCNAFLLLEDGCTCEACDKAIKNGDMHTYDSVNMICLCEGCSPTWQNMLDEPDSYWHGEDDEGDPIYLNSETVTPLVQAHLDAGGSLDDKMNLQKYEG